MHGSYGFWQFVEFIVDLFTKEGRRNFAKFLLMLLAGAAIFVAATYLLTGTGPWPILTSQDAAAQPEK